MQTISTITLLALMPSALLAAPFDKRQDSVGASLVGLLSTEFKSVFGTTPYCCQSITDEDCWASSSGSGAKLPWQLCYAKGDQVYTAADAAVVNCLTNLHYTQSDTCISVAGSSCDLNNYIANGGRIQNTKLSWWGAHNKLNADQSAAIQNASTNFIGVATATDLTKADSNGVIFAPISPTNGVEEVEMNVQYIGEDAC